MLHEWLRSDSYSSRFVCSLNLPTVSSFTSTGKQHLTLRLVTHLPRSNHRLLWAGIMHTSHWPKANKSSKIQSRTALPVNVDRQPFFFSGYEAQASWVLLLQGSRLAVTALSIWILIILCCPVSFCATLNCSLLSVIFSPVAWTKEESAAWSQLLCRTLTMCVTVKANALKEERARGRDARADLYNNRLCYSYVASAPVGHKDLQLKTQETHLWRPRITSVRSKETLRAVKCRFCSFLPVGALLNTTHPVSI